MSIAVLVVMVILGIITFGAGMPEKDVDSVMSNLMGSQAKPRTHLLVIGTVIVVVGILALAWVPAIERFLA